MPGIVQTTLIMKLTGENVYATKAMKKTPMETVPPSENVQNTALGSSGRRIVSAGTDMKEKETIVSKSRLALGTNISMKISRNVFPALNSHFGMTTKKNVSVLEFMKNGATSVFFLAEETKSEMPTENVSVKMDITGLVDSAKPAHQTQSTTQTQSLASVREDITGSTESVIPVLPIKFGTILPKSAFAKTDITGSTENAILAHPTKFGTPNLENVSAKEATTGSMEDVIPVLMVRSGTILPRSVSVRKVLT